MSTLSEQRIAELLQPYLGPAPRMESESGFDFQVIENKVFNKLRAFLDLLLRWNARTNLTAITDPEEVVRRHFGESLFTARHLATSLAAAALQSGQRATLLDFGSGGGFPGIPIQLSLPRLRVTLAESQGKKAAFLREAVRTLGLETEVWATRVEAMAAGRRFDAVTLRAVDRMEAALPLAEARVAEGGTLAVLGGAEPPRIDPGWQKEAFDLPESDARRLYLLRRDGLSKSS